MESHTPHRVLPMSEHEYASRRLKHCLTPIAGNARRLSLVSHTLQLVSLLEEEA
jgi:hypothetical protein